MYEQDIQLARLLIGKLDEMSSRQEDLIAQLKLVQAELIESQKVREERSSYEDVLARAAELLARPDLRMASPEINDLQEQADSLQIEVGEIEGAMAEYRKLVDELNRIFSAFDTIVETHGIEKIKTIGDAYLAAGGLPHDRTDHATACVTAAMAMLAFIDAENRENAIKWRMRVGVHSGAVVAGVVGRRKFTYDIWGDTVNIAARLENAAEAGRINVSAYTYDLIRQDIACAYRGKIAVKGKGKIDMYYVVGERQPAERGCRASAAARPVEAFAVRS